MSTLTAEALVLRRHGEVPAVESVQVLDPGPGEVRVALSVAGICHTDVGAVRDARTVPAVLGHEGAGRIEAVGDGVRTVAVGDRVVLFWRPPCGACVSCRRDAPERCEQPRTVAAPRVLAGDGEPLWPLLGTGCLAQLCVVPENAVIPVPAQVSDRAAALVGCAVATGVGAALWSARLRPGDSVGIWGAGAVGRHVAVGAAMAGAGPIVCCDPLAARRADALVAGAHQAVAPEEMAAAIDAATAGRGVDAAFDVVGRPASTEAALAALAPSGQLVLVGAAARDATVAFHPRAFMSRQQRIVGCIYGSVRGDAELPELLGWCADGRLDPESLIGEEITLGDAPGCFARPGDGTRTVVRFA